MIQLTDEQKKNVLHWIRLGIMHLAVWILVKCGWEIEKIDKGVIVRYECNKE